MTDLRQTPEYAQYMQLLGWSVIRLQTSDFKCQIFIKKIPLFGNIAKLQRPQGKLDIKKLKKFARKNTLAALYIEPSFGNQSTIQDSQFKIHKNCFLPSKTIQIDLQKKEENLLKEMKPKTRYNIKLAQKLKVSVAQSMDIDLFIKLWEKSARKRGMWLSQKREISALFNAFANKGCILFAYKNSNQNSVVHFDTLVYQSIPIAGVLMVRASNTAYYMYAFSTKVGNQLFAPSLLAWEAIKLAKRKKCKLFDFEGIYDERYKQTKNWKGFTRFKEGFGGRIVSYPQTLVCYHSPLARLLNL